MFQKTLKKLTILNSVVFFFIFLCFGATIYGYVGYRLFDAVDHAMRVKSDAFRITNGRPAMIMSSPALFDPRIFILLRDADNQILNLYPGPIENADDLTRLATQAVTGRLQGRRLGSHLYRILSFPYQHEDNILIRSGGSFVIREVIAISIVDSEVALLRSLMIVIFAGLISCIMIIITAGYFLARRALVPIQAAWDKQQQFVADASHELRTPLTVIKSNAELVLRHPNHTVEEESIRITNIIRETLRMTKLIATLLTLARADANQAELNLAPTVLNTVIDAVVAQFQPLAEMKGVTLVLDIENQIEVLADRERLHQLFVILLDNAVKYTSPPGKITLSCRRFFGNILITVEDTGSGIKPEHLPYVFDRFFRGDKARSREEGGTGLGLAIAKWIVEKHEGKIRVESKAGSGTRFIVTIPSARKDTAS